jgi:serine phosphatase RsbU (regulator of sigma subunit)/integral membrane sensor domain MASE1/anti-sigma regulatory factor (Ser/Thr protein kinase)
VTGTPWRSRVGALAAGRRGGVALFGVVAGAYAVGYVLAWKWFSAPGQGASFFPPAGLTVATLVLVRRDRWPVVLAAAATAEVALDLGRGSSLGGTAGIVLANLAEPLVGALLLLRLVGEVDLRRKRHLSAFLGAAVVAAPVVGASIAATTFVYVIGGSGWLRFASEWWAGDGLAVLVVGGAILSLRFPVRLPPHRLVESVVLSGLAVLCTYVLFDEGWFAFVYVPVVVLVVLAFRVGASGVAVTGALVAFVAAGMTAEADAFWASVDVSPADRVLYLQLALSIIVATVLALAAEIAERERIVARLARSEAERSAAFERSELAGRADLAGLQARLLRQSAEQLSRSVTVDDVAAVAVATVREWGADHSAFFVLRDERLELRAMLGPEGPSGALHGETLLTVETPVTAAVKRGQVVVPDWAELRNRFPPFARVLEDRRWKSYGVFPVEAGGAVCGALTVAAADEDWLTEERCDLLVPLSAQAGVALARALLHEETQAARLREQVVARLAATLDRAMGFHERAEAAARLLVRNGLELVRIHQLENDGTLHLVASAGVRRGDARMRGLDRLASVVAESGETALVRDEPDGSVEIGRRGAVAALHARGQLLGTLTLRLPEGSALEMTAAFAEDVASRLSHSLDNAMRYERERDVSHALQAGLLGRAPGTVEGAEIASVYRPGTEALEVGGDWYDVFRLRDRTLALVVGDVVGHGLDAAVAMGQLRGAVRALAPTGSPSRILEALDLFVEQVPQAAMATLAYAELDLEDGALTYACAGHPPPLLVGEDGCQLLWDGRSLPLGTSFDGHRRTQATGRVATGETIVLYTDGLVEDRRRGISSGLDLLLEVAAQADGAGPSDLVDRILDRLGEEIDGEDDICVLAVRRSLSTARFVHAFPAVPAEVRKMRHALSEWLEAAGVEAERRDDVVLAASEAAANAVEHGYRFDPAGTVRLEAWANHDSIHVSVHDGGSWRVPRRRSDRGRGRAIMEALMRDVSFESDGGGTVVRMRLPLVRPVLG